MRGCFVDDNGRCRIRSVQALVKVLRCLLFPCEKMRLTHIEIDVTICMSQPRVWFQEKSIFRESARGRGG